MAQQTLHRSSFDLCIWAFNVRAHEGYRVCLENGASRADSLCLDLPIFVLQHLVFFIQSLQYRFNCSLLRIIDLNFLQGHLTICQTPAHGVHVPALCHQNNSRPEKNKTDRKVAQERHLGPSQEEYVEKND